MRRSHSFDTKRWRVFVSIWEHHFTKAEPSHVLNVSITRKGRKL